MKATGGCLCGAMRYEIDGEPAFMGHCHCTDCQKATGAGHGSVIGMPQVAVTITGETKGYTSKGESGMSITRHFCPTCGSFLFSAPEAMGGFINIAAGTLDDPSLFQPQVVIYTRDRRAWDHIDSGLPEFEGMPRPGAA